MVRECLTRLRTTIYVSTKLYLRPRMPNYLVVIVPVMFVFEYISVVALPLVYLEQVLQQAFVAPVQFPLMVGTSLFLHAGVG